MCPLVEGTSNRLHVGNKGNTFPKGPIFPKMGMYAFARGRGTQYVFLLSGHMDPTMR